METLRTHLSTAHQETLDLLEQFTDEQLAAPVSLLSGEHDCWQLVRRECPARSDASDMD
jgi:hypothetical protein